MNGIRVEGPHKKLNAAIEGAAAAKLKLEKNVDESFDAAVAAGWELGTLNERMRVYETIDALINGLADSEEDAKMALDILKKALIESEGNDDMEEVANE